MVMSKAKKQIPDLLPELGIIFHCISASEDRDTTISATLNKGIDWRRLENLARHHKVLPLLYHRLTKIDNSVVEKEGMGRLQSIYRYNATRNLKLSVNLHRVLELLAREGIEVIVFKGPALAVRAYDDLSHRTFADLDLLIRPEDFAKIYDTMTTAGFRSPVPLDKKKMRYWQSFRRNLDFNDDISGFDFHQQLIQGPKKFSLKEKTWQNKCTGQLLTRDISLLSPEHSLFSLCLHGIKENWSFLRSLSDIAHLLARHPHLNWNSLTAAIEEIGCLSVLLTGLQLCRLVCGLELPGEISGLISSHRQVEDLAWKYYRQIVTGETKADRLRDTFSFIRSLDSAASRLSLLMYTLFVPTPLDWKSLNLPGFLYPLYFLIRPMRLFFKLLGRIF